MGAKTRWMSLVVTGRLTYFEFTSCAPLQLLSACKTLVNDVKYNITLTEVLCVQM